MPLNHRPKGMSSHAVTMGLIQRAVQRFGGDKLHGGNCGTFALALGRCLQQLSFPPKLGFIYRLPLLKDSEPGASVFDTVPAPCATISEVIAAETDIYHVFMMLGRRFYDGTGTLSVQTLLAIAADQYGDDDPGDFTDIDLTDPAMLTLIDNDTQHTIDAATFETAMLP